MTKKIYSVYDQKAEVFHSPFYLTTHGEAERQFQTAVNDPKTQFSVYPEDFDLYYLGEYDDNKGQFVNLKKSPEHMHKAISLLRKISNNQPDLKEA